MAASDHVDDVRADWPGGHDFVVALAQHAKETRTGPPTDGDEL